MSILLNTIKQIITKSNLTDTELSELKDYIDKLNKPNLTIIHKNN